TEVAPGSVDVVVAAEVLEHIDDPTETLALFHRVLKRSPDPASDGSLLVSLPTENRAYRFGRRLAGVDGHFHVHDAASLARRIRAGGFRPIESRSVPLPGPLSIYLVARYAPAPAA